MRPWVTFFSQTGTDIYNLTKKIGKVPDKIVTNRSFEEINSINQHLVNEYYDRLYFIPTKPTIEEYETVLESENTLVTLHGYLRIVPEHICNIYEIYNLHPAPLTLYPFQKGKDPQIRCYQHGLEYSGNTIHKCTAELDSGEIMLESSFKVTRFSLDRIFKDTHQAATTLWCQFLKDRL
jgi:folate-dependent phosphoribosylglycinamide formyltransferase PurN